MQCNSNSLELVPYGFQYQVAKLTDVAATMYVLSAGQCQCTVSLIYNLIE
jgi:hypothetical protein